MKTNELCKIHNLETKFERCQRCGIGGLFCSSCLTEHCSSLKKGEEMKSDETFAKINARIIQLENNNRAIKDYVMKSTLFFQILKQNFEKNIESLQQKSLIIYKNRNTLKTFIEKNTFESSFSSGDIPCFDNVDLTYFHNEFMKMIFKELNKIIPVAQNLKFLSIKCPLTFANLNDSEKICHSFPNDERIAQLLDSKIKENKQKFTVNSIYKEDINFHPLNLKELNQKKSNALKLGTDLKIESISSLNNSNFPLIKSVNNISMENDKDEFLGNCNTIPVLSKLTDSLISNLEPLIIPGFEHYHTYHANYTLFTQDFLEKQNLKVSKTSILTYLNKYNYIHSQVEFIRGMMAESTARYIRRAERDTISDVVGKLIVEVTELINILINVKLSYNKILLLKTKNEWKKLSKKILMESIDELKLNWSKGKSLELKSEETLLKSLTI